MTTRTDGGADKVVSFDAFKIARHRVDQSTAWTVGALTPWAQDLLIRYAATIPPHERPQWRRGTGDRIIGVSFAKRADAYDFLAFVEQKAAVWS